ARHRKPSSSSAMTSTPAARAACSSGSAHGTPGDTTTRSAAVKVPLSCAPSSSLAPLSPSPLTSASRSAAGLRSVATTCAPRRRRSSAAATPERAIPTTTALLPSSSTGSSPQLERRDRGEREDERHDEEADDDLRLLPPDELEVVVEGSHAEDPLARQLEGGDLEDHRHRLGHEHPAHHHQEQLLLDEDGDGAQGAP